MPTVRKSEMDARTSEILMIYTEKMKFVYKYYLLELK